MWQKFVMMEEDYDEDYEPTQEEIINYAQFIGMSPRSDAKYFHICREALKTPLPYPWKPARGEDGEDYYFNTETQQIQIDHPLDEHFKRVYIDAKKKDNQTTQPSKVSQKLKNLCAKLRTDEDEELQTAKKPPQPPQQTQTVKFEQKQFKEKDLVISDIDDFADDDLKKNENSIVELEKQCLLEFHKYQQEQREKFESQVAKLKQQQNTEEDYFNIGDEAIKLRGKFLKEKDEIKNQLELEFNQSIKNKIKDEELKVQERINTYKVSKTQISKDQLRQLELKLKERVDKQMDKVESLKTQLANNKIEQQEQVKQHQDGVNQKFSKMVQQLKSQIQREQEIELRQMEKQFENQKQQVKIDYNNSLIKQRNQLSEEYLDYTYKRKTQLKLLYKEKLELFRISEEQNLLDSIKQEQFKLQKQLNQLISQYDQEARDSLLESVQLRIERENNNLNKYYQDQLAFFKNDFRKQYQLDRQRLDLEKDANLNESFTNFSKLYSSEKNSNLIKELQKLQFEKQDYLNKIRYCKEQLIELEMQKQLNSYYESLNTQVNKLQYLKNINMELDLQLNKQVSYGSQRQITTPIPTPPKISQKDNWIEQLETEKKWLALQKERLKYDKKQLQQIYQKLNLLSSNQEQIDQYNQSVDQVRYNQQLIQNSEYVINKAEENLKEYQKSRIIDYLKLNDTLFEDLTKWKQQLNEEKKLPVEESYYFNSCKMKCKSMHLQENSQGQIKQFLTSQKQVLQSIKEHLNKTMMDRLY